MSTPDPAQIAQLQDQLLKTASKLARPISPATQAAFRAVPRHAFVKQFWTGEKFVTVTPENLARLLPSIYRDGVLPLWEDREKETYSTLSQPSLVLSMLDDLELEPGHKVFELGAGSGWSAALMGKLVEPGGRVYSAEIIPELARRAQRCIAELGIQNVDIIEGDAGDGYPAAAPFDRAVFTAGTYDLPAAFHEQIRIGGRLILVVKIEGGGDQLVVLEKKTDCFQSQRGTLCSFVPMTGNHVAPDLGPKPLEAIPDWPTLQTKKLGSRGFWWGGGSEAAAWGAVGVRSFLSIVEPRFRVFRDATDGKGSKNRETYFGLYDPAAKSLVVTQKGVLTSYGNHVARDLLLARLHEWVDLGMPSMSSMRLRIYPAAAQVSTVRNEWTVRRKESTFVWSLSAES